MHFVSPHLVPLQIYLQLHVPCFYTMHPRTIIECCSPCHQYPHHRQLCHLLLVDLHHLLSGVLHNPSCPHFLNHYLLLLLLLLQGISRPYICLATRSHRREKAAPQRRAPAVAQLHPHTVISQSSTAPVSASRMTALSCKNFGGFTFNSNLTISVVMCWSLPRISLAPDSSSRNSNVWMLMRSRWSLSSSLLISTR